MSELQVIPVYVLQSQLDEAQRALNTAVDGDYFDDLRGPNEKKTYERLRKRSLELLAEQYPGLDVRIVNHPASEMVDLEVFAVKGVEVRKG